VIKLWKNRDDTMKSKKGFTIVEILAVLIILALLFTIVTPIVSESSKKAREKSFKTKVSTLEAMTTTFGQDNYGLIVAKSATLPCVYSESGTDQFCKIKLKELVPDYIVPDNEGSTNMIEDPRNKSLSLDECTMTIKVDKKNRTVSTTFDESECNKSTT